MARFRGPKGKICRRFGENIYGSDKYSALLSKKGYKPGMHGQKFTSNQSEYGKQLSMKQKAKFTYGILEKQFRKHYEDIKNLEGVVGDNFLARLEQRMDNVIYRLGFAVNRPQARQAVNHGMFLVNGKKMTIPSYEVKIGDEITVNPTKAENGYFKNLKELSPSKKTAPSWLVIDAKKITGKVISKPKQGDFEANIDAAVIVEFFSK